MYVTAHISNFWNHCDPCYYHWYWTNKQNDLSVSYGQCDTSSTVFCMVIFVVVAQLLLCPTLCSPMVCSTPGSPVLHRLLEFAQIHVRWVDGCKSYLSNHLILCCPLLLLPSVFPSTRVFSRELVLWIRWPKYWSFNFNISPSNEYLGLISFRISWFFSLFCSPKIYGLHIFVYIYANIFAYICLYMSI